MKSQNYLAGGGFPESRYILEPGLRLDSQPLLQSIHAPKCADPSISFGGVQTPSLSFGCSCLSHIASPSISICLAALILADGRGQGLDCRKLFRCNLPHIFLELIHELASLHRRLTHDIGIWCTRLYDISGRRLNVILFYSPCGFHTKVFA